MIASSWKGKEYIREYAVPGGEPSDRQLEQRAVFGQAANAWKALTLRQQQFYDHIADGMSGYNLFTGRAAQAIRAGREPETPIPLEYATENGAGVPGADLVVRQGTLQVWVEDLKDGKGDIALTPSDAPYTFLLRKEGREDIVALMKAFLESSVPLVLESAILGIRLVRTVPDAKPVPPVEAEATA